MLKLHEIELVQFRNYALQKISFTERIVAICGLNGTGKTNLLDAIYYLGFSRSYFARTDAQNVQHGNMGMRISGQYTLFNTPYTITCILRENNRKELLLNDDPYKKISEHMGKFPCVMIAPDDISLIAGSGEERRKLIDTILSQSDPQYLMSLITYTKILQQRNGFLKQQEPNTYIDNTLLDVLNQQLVKTGNYVFEQRVKFLAQFIPMIQKKYVEIAEKTDGLSISYESQLLEHNFNELLTQSFQKDCILQRTTKGIHRDDLLIQLNQYAFKATASQGQRKSLLFAIKLAEWQYLKEKKGFPPILLLDDIFEKLDENRMFQLLKIVCSNEYGQVFITDTHTIRLKVQLVQTGSAFQLLNL